jgi:hypothetical protein
VTDSGIRHWLFAGRFRSPPKSLENQQFRAQCKRDLAELIPAAWLFSYNPGFDGKVQGGTR